MEWRVSSKATRTLPWDLVPGIPADSRLPATQGQHHRNTTQNLPPFLVFLETFFFSFFPSLHFSWARLPCSCPICHWQQRDISPKANGTNGLHTSLSAGEPGQVNNDLVSQVILYGSLTTVRKFQFKCRDERVGEGRFSADMVHCLLSFPWSLN